VPRIDRSCKVYASDTGHNGVRKVDSTGIVATVAGTVTAGFRGDGGLDTCSRLTSSMA
jgi:hypothetical protein